VLHEGCTQAQRRHRDNCHIQQLGPELHCMLAKLKQASADVLHAEHAAGSGSSGRCESVQVV
jgi:hypothetical protein